MNTRGDLLGPYEWVTSPARFHGLIEHVRHLGPDDVQTRLVALTVAYRRVRPGIGLCPLHRYRGDRLGCCTRPRGHGGAHRFLLLSRADSRAIEVGMRRVVEPDPIPEVAR